MVQQTHTGFQTIVNAQPAPGQPGDFYGVNMRAVVLGSNVPYGSPGSSGQRALGQLVAPAGGLVVGNFAWADLNTGLVSQGYDSAGQLGFLHREEQAIIVTYLGISTYVVNAGFPVTLFSQGDFWGLFAGGANPGDKVYADPDTGALLAGATAPTTASVTGAVGASFTGIVVSNVLTVSALTGFLSQGDLITGTGVTGVALGPQLTGPAGGAGTYTLTHADVTSEAMTSTSTVLNVTAVGSGSIGAGDVLTGPSGSPTITGQIAGTPGGIGQYQLSGSAISFASGTITVAAIATNFKVKSKCAAGEVAKISSWG